MIFFLFVGFGGTAYSAPDLDRSLKPEDPEDVRAIFKDIVVLQRKAKHKSGSILLNPAGSLEFSDGPITFHSFNINVGYALSDFWEIYMSFVPVFITQEREIVSQINDLELASGNKVNLTTAKPKSQVGFELLYAPAYGKESWGPKSIIRSDTFFKLSVGQIQYENASGSRYGLQIGKSFFISRWFNTRASVGLNSVEYIIDNQSSNKIIAVTEFGLMFYF